MKLRIYASLKFYFAFIYKIFKYMGAQITVDKHTTPLDDWLDLQDKLETINLQQDQELHSHIAAWKFFMDQVNPQQFNSLPVDLDLNSIYQLLSPHETYVIYAIYNKDELVIKQNISVFDTLVHSIKKNIEEQSYEVPIKTGIVENCTYCIYAYLGKLSKPKIRLAAFSYALKAEGILNSKKKLTILSDGGVLRNKKLQKGSTISLLANVSQLSKQVSNYENIHIFTYYWKQQKKTNRLLSYKSSKSDTFIICEQRVAKNVGVKPPLLKLSLKPFQQVTYNQIEEEQKNGQIKFDIRATARHQLKMEKFQSECSQILQGIFVSGQKIAKSIQLLQKNRIKAIINCAGDYCQNWFQNKAITYLTFFLKDSQNQNIQCLFYRAIDFIQTAQKNKQNVLIHCIQGVSRSISIVIAYIIFKLGYDYKKAELFVKQKRGIACPNNGFMVELIQFHKRLYEDFNSLPTPRVFLVSSHSKETPQIITARLLKHSLFDKKGIGLDSRAIYIIQTPEIVYLWVGSKCQEKRLQEYWSFSQQYIKKLQKYEKASLKLKAISQGTQIKEFLSLWNLQDPPSIYQNPEYNRLFYQGEATKPGGMRKFYQRQVQEESQAKLFTYPDYEKGLGVFEFDDLTSLNILACNLGENLKIYICKSENSIQDQSKIGQFLDNVIQTHYQNFQTGQIIVEQQSLQNPSEGFLSYF